MAPSPTPEKLTRAPSLKPPWWLVVFDTLCGVVSILLGIASVGLIIRSSHRAAAELGALAGLLLAILAMVAWWFTSRPTRRIHTIALLLNASSLAIVYFSSGKLPAAVTDTQAVIERVREFVQPTPSKQSPPETEEKPAPATGETPDEPQEPPTDAGET